VTRHEDWDAIVVITAAVIDLFNRIATGQDRAGRFAFGEKLFPYPRRLRFRPASEANPFHSCSLMKPSPPGLAGPSFAPAIYPSSDIDM
jgi:hypothetical protein